MTDLAERMRQAAGGPPPGFDSADIRRRVDRSRRRGRLLAGAALVVALVGAALVATHVVRGSEGPGDRVAAGSVGTSELTSTPWILSFMGGEPVLGIKPAWVSFRPDGSVVGDGGCGPFTATWRWNGAALDVDGLDGRPEGCDVPKGSAIVGKPEPMIDLLRTDPAPGPAEVTADGLRLSAGTPGSQRPWIELAPFEELDQVTNPIDLTGPWEIADGSSLNVKESLIDGTTGCDAPTPWSLDKHGLSVPACIHEALGLPTTGLLQVRRFAQVIWLSDGDRLAWLLPASTTIPAGFDDLVGGRWVVRGLPGVGSMRTAAWIELHADGIVDVDNGACGVFEGNWTVTNGVLEGHDLLPGVVPHETGTCSPPGFDLQADLIAGLRLGRPDGAGDQLQLEPVSGRSPGSEPWVLRRFNRIGRVATAADVVGMWEGQDGGAWGATFAENGTVELSANGCREIRSWSFEHGVLSIGEATGEACGATEFALGALAPLDTIDARVDGRTLWLSGLGGVLSAFRLA